MSDVSLSSIAFPKYEEEDLFCHDLPIKSDLGIGKILVTGASGYIGGRLVPELLARGYKVRIMVREALPVYKERWPGVEIAVADALILDQLKAAMEGINTAYYLIHSLGLSHKTFEVTDVQAAANFIKAAEQNQVARIIYLGGLGDAGTRLSRAVRSRKYVAEELSRGKIPVTILRAPLIIGSGSASYELTQHLVKKMPILLIPSWATNNCQPISVRDVIKYLVGVLEVPETSGRRFDIGGKDVLSYEKMLRVMARALHKKPVIKRFPGIPMGIYTYLGSLLTPVPVPIVRCLVEGLKDIAVCQDDTIKDFVPFEPLNYEESIMEAVAREEQDKVDTRWANAYPRNHALALRMHQLEKPPQYKISHSVISDKDATLIFANACKVGGTRGWFRGNWLWRLRGGFDRLIFGVGSVRGRRSTSRLHVNDVVDFLRVEDIKPGERLLLRVEMRIPGKGWMEFTTRAEGDKTRFEATAHFQPEGLFGRLYWYTLIPFHRFFINDLVEQIEKTA